MDQFFQMLDLQLTFLLNLLIGVFAYRMKMITNENRTHFISIILNILLPALVFNSFKNLTTDLLISGLYILIASTLVYTGSYIIGVMHNSLFFLIEITECKCSNDIRARIYQCRRD